MKGFKQFLLRGNVVDLAVGIVIGAAFAGLVSAIVKDLLTPLIGAVAKLPDFSELGFRINGSKFSYGDFLNASPGLCDRIGGGVFSSGIASQQTDGFSEESSGPDHAAVLGMPERHTLAGRTLQVLYIDVSEGLTNQSLRKNIRVGSAVLVRTPPKFSAGLSRCRVVRFCPPVSLP